MPFPSINDSSNYSRYRLRKRSEIVSPCHQLQIKRHKKVHNYSQKYIDDFKLNVVDPPLNLTNQLKRNIVTYFLLIYQYQSIENNTRRIITYTLKRWDGNKSSATPSANAMTSAEVVALKLYSIELK